MDTSRPRTLLQRADQSKDWSSEPTTFSAFQAKTNTSDHHNENFVSSKFVTGGLFFHQVTHGIHLILHYEFDISKAFI